MPYNFIDYKIYTLEKKKYFKNLDATRFIAFLAVFSEHVFVSVNGENLNEGLFQQTSSYVKSFMHSAYTSISP